MSRLAGPLAVTGAALVSQGLALLNDGIFWDDWIYLTQMREGRWDLVIGHYVDLGVPLQLVPLLLPGLLPDPIPAYRVAALVALIAVGLLAAASFRSLGLAGDRDSWLAGILVVASPIYVVLISPALLPYLVHVALFLGGVVLAARAERTARPLSAWRVAALAAFTLSFAYPLLLVAYAGLGLVVFGRWRRAGVSARAFVARHADFVLLPVAVRLASAVFLPQRGVAADAYGLRPVSQWPADLAAAATTLSVDLPMRMLFAVRDAPLLAGAALVIALALTARAAGVSHVPARVAILAAGVLVLFAILPSAMTGRRPASEGWALRHAFMAGVPLALIPVALAGALARHGPRARALGALVLAAVIASSTVTSMLDHLGWIARWAKDRAVMTRLAELDDGRRASVIWVRDAYPLGGEREYRFYERVGMFGLAWGDRGRIGLDLPVYDASFLAEGSAYFGPMYLLEGLDVRGCQAELLIDRAAGLGETELGLRYLVARWSGRAELDALLRDVASVELRHVDAPFATSCVPRG